MYEKTSVWLGPFWDNFAKLGKSNVEIEQQIQFGNIEITPITFLQGRSISNAIICIDEIQNLDMKIIKQIITRAGENTKIILLGDPSQRFEKGDVSFDRFIEQGKQSELFGHIQFRKSIRSPIAQWAIEHL